MASCVLLLLLSLVYCCCRWCRGCLQQLSPCYFSFLLRAVGKEKSCESISRENESLFFFRCSRDFFLCVINSSIVGGFDLEVVV